MAETHKVDRIALRRQALEVARIHPGTRGICRHCGCTENNACILQVSIGRQMCSWWNRTQTCCTNPRCIEKEKAAA